MEMQYYKWFSQALGRDMEFKIYGHAGRPVLFIPCQNGRFYDFEDYRMTEVWSPWIESGRVMVCAVDTMDRETWSNEQGNPRWRIARHEQWMRHITDEIVPFLRQVVNEHNGWSGYPGVITFGCSLGATHAANLFFRRPDLFDGLLALSGIYSAEYGFGSYMDEQVYNNSPVDYLKDMPNDHPYIQLYNLKRAVLCVGQGPWELPESTRAMQQIFDTKGIQAWVDYWGYDCSHDWYWWHRQTEYFVPYLLGETQ